MEIKWLLIGWAAVMGVMFVGMGYEAHTKSECRQAYAQTARTADEIGKICK